MKQSLSFAWKFIPGFLGSYLQGLPENAESVDIPHCPLTLPMNYFDEKSYQGLFTYQKRFDAPDSKQGLTFLLFEGVMLKAHVYLNGKDLGQKISGWTPLVFDITRDVKEKDNLLIVVVDATENPHIPPFGHAVDYLTFAGIYRPVYLVSEPTTYLQDLFITTNDKGHLHLVPTIVGEASKATLSYTLSFGGQLLKSFSSNDLDVPEVSLWDLDTPNLYDLEATLVSPAGKESKKYRIGFRSVSFSVNGFFLNGKKIKLLGLNRHQNYPYVGPAMPESAQKDDADILKRKLGCNIVRTSHYSDSEAFLSHCDEIGLLVLDEVPGWQYTTLTDKEWRANFYAFIKAMALKERNHPSLVAYGTRIDESADDDDLYSNGLKLIKEVDPSRATLGVRNFKTSHCLEDVYGYNDFSCSSLEHGLDDPETIKGAKNKPILITEHNGHMFPTKQFDSPARRLEQALRHLKVIDDAFGYDRLCGAIGWCAFDYNTHSDFGAGDRICYHGVEDIYRNPKAAAFAYASQNSRLPVMWIANPPTTGDYDEALLKPLYIFTNCDYVEFYRNGDFIEVFKPDTKDFPHLPHAPIVVNDFIGALMKKENYSKKDGDKLKEALNLVGQNGIAHLKKRQLAKYAPVIFRNHLKYEDLLGLYYKYMTGWGDKAMIYNFKGYKEGKLVCEKSYGPSTQFSYRFEVSQQALQNAATYDVARVSIKFVDEWGSQMHYAHNVVSFKTMGPIEVIGPKQVALQGGDVSVYVRSQFVTRSMEARLVVSTDLGDYPLDFTVQ